VLITADETRAAVEVAADPDRADGSTAELFATDDTGAPGHVGVVLTRKGDVIAGLEATDGRPAELWTNEP
jgi:hypothetical protein